MALEEPKEDDLKIESEGYNFIIGDGLDELYGRFIVDYSDSMLRKGFAILPRKA